MARGRAAGACSSVATCQSWWSGHQRCSGSGRRQSSTGATFPIASSGGPVTGPPAASVARPTGFCGLIEKFYMSHKMPKKYFTENILHEKYLHWKIYYFKTNRV